MMARFLAMFLLLPTLLQAGGEDWMKKLDAGKSLASLSIPGTHDAGARFEPMAATAKCQELTIPQQLEAGVRFLDIRCRHRKDTFRIHHGSVDQRIDFTTVQDEVLTFLEKNRGETVIMSVKEEHRPQGNSRTFPETFADLTAAHRDRWWLGKRVPTLGEARGKIVLFRRFGAPGELGIDATAWPNNRRFEQNGLRVQDRYRVASPEEKWQEVEAMLEETRKAAGPLTLNFTSGYVTRGFGIPDITKVSRGVNPKVMEYLVANPKAPVGVLVMDFITPELAKAIYQRNH
ncbi:MAG: phosphatidylinositol-specific phospholipase C [Akkermansiaceae bacterium]|jgi:1-phosphatidylinositol phosphodiesterase|nr:phosphatidylinositol-specific phospholipase C [Akkermansiaceae bacterium]